MKHQLNNLSLNPQNGASYVLSLIHEDKCAEALLFLYNCHKNKLSLWILLKAELLSQATSHRDLCLTATLLSASSKTCLSDSCSIVPGLYSLIFKQNNENESTEKLC